MSLTVPFQYAGGGAPRGYVCGACGVGGQKLWVDWGCFAIALDFRCARCAMEEEHIFGTVDADGFSLRGGIRIDRIGVQIPAVLTQDGESCWPYSDVPAEAAAWWRALPSYAPTQATPPPTLVAHRIAELEREIARTDEVLDEFSTHHTGKSLHESAEEMASTLRRRIAEENVRAVKAEREIAACFDFLGPVAKDSGQSLLTYLKVGAQTIRDLEARLDAASVRERTAAVKR